MDPEPLYELYTRINDQHYGGSLPEVGDNMDGPSIDLEWGTLPLAGPCMMSRNGADITFTIGICGGARLQQAVLHATVHLQTLIDTGSTTHDATFISNAKAVGLWQEWWYPVDTSERYFHKQAPVLASWVTPVKIQRLGNISETVDVRHLTGEEVEHIHQQAMLVKAQTLRRRELLGI